MAQPVEPIMLRKFSFKKSGLKHLDVLASLDRGCSLTKIIYVDKSDAYQLGNDSKSEIVFLTASLFPNTGFDDALIWLKEKAFFPENKSFPFHLTGVGGVKYKEKIENILERDVIFIDEFMAQSRGTYYLLRNVPLEEIVFPEIEADCTKAFDARFITNVKHQFEELVGKINDKIDALPCIFGMFGSACGFTYIGPDGKYRIVSGLPAAGKTFIGISRYILGTNNYDEITSMAARGDRYKVDLQVKDILPEESLYENIPTNLPIIHMGKLANTKKSIKEFNKDDIAHSLVSLFMYNAMNAAVHVCMTEKVFNVFLGGNLFQAEIFRKEFSSLKKMLGLDFINIYFLNNGNTGALGAMICDPDDLGKYSSS